MLRDKLAARLGEMGTAPDYSRLASEVLGIRGARGDLARRLVSHALLMGDRRDTWRRVGERIRQDAPDSPGVYVFRDGEGQVLYVGKAANLRRRLGGHFADRRWLTLKPAMARVVAVEWQEVGSEIEALVREAALIRELKPVVNIQVGTPASRTRRIPRRIFRDVVIVVPSIAPDSAELIAARTDGSWMLQRTPRAGVELAGHAERVWQFFHDPPGPEVNANESALAPLVFSWLAGRGGDATRIDPHHAESRAHFCASLERLLKDTRLFLERLILR